MEIKVRKLSPEAKLPAYSHAGDAGLDLFALENTELEPGVRAQVKTGIALEIPDGHVGLIWDKSGLAQKFGLKTLGGVVDATYRGEVLVGIANISKERYVVEAGHKVAQMLIQKVEQVTVVEVKELTQTNRGQSGFGSTGK
ncbi:MAG TPA: dUTP diphosphatase [Candidatus Paceibacterota bacterium]